MRRRSVQAARDAATAVSASPVDAVRRGVIHLACPVCFTGDNPVVRESLSAGIGVLVGVTLVVLGCFACFFIVLARRARAAASATDDGPEAASPRPLPPRMDRVPGGAH